MRLLEELKQRNVFRVAVLYIVVAWLVLQVADVVFGVFQLPPWALTLTAAMLAIGLLPAIVFAWVFEVTPEGIKREKDVDRSTAAGEERSQRMTVVTVGLLVVAIGLFVSEPMWRGGTGPTTAEAVAETDASTLDLGIAVLPFRNLSADEDNAFFAGGVHEEVLQNLSLINGLRVISSTSMLRIAESDLDVRGIGSRLGVSHVMQGSVRRADNRVRVSVQLINAKTDEQLWTANYDDTLDDIFAIQSDIAQQIANSLRATLSPDAVASMEARPTDNQAAYDLYLRALQELSFWQGSETFTKMRAQLEEALRLDPTFIEARVLLLSAYGRLYWLRWETTDDVFAEQAAEQLALIKAQAPTSMAARQANAFYTYTVERDYEAALALLEPLSEELPNNMGILRYLSASLKRLQKSERFLEAALRSKEIDPESATAASELSMAFVDNRMLPEAEAESRRTVLLYPEDLASLYQLRNVLMLRGKDADALEITNRMIALEPEVRFQREQLWLTYATRGLGAARDAYDPGAPESDGSGVLPAEMALILRHAGGYQEEAQQLAETAFSLLSEQIKKDLPVMIERVRLDAFSYMAMVAALAGDAERYQEYREQFDAVLAGRGEGQWSDFELAREYFDLAFGQALLGAPEDGWATLAQYSDNGMADLEFAVPRARSDLAFGSVPAYQDYIARNTPAWTAE